MKSPVIVIWIGLIPLLGSLAFGCVGSHACSCFGSLKAYPTVRLNDADITALELDSIPEGRIEDAIEWLDKDGWHRFLIIERRQGKYLVDHDWNSEITFVRFDGSGEEYEFHETLRYADSLSSNDNDDFDYLDRSLLVYDADMDNIPELYLHYLWRFGDGGAMIMLVVDGPIVAKFSGRIPSKNTESDEFIPASNFLSLPEQVQKFSKKHWDEFYACTHRKYRSGYFY